MLAQLKLKTKIGTIYLTASEHGLEGVHWNIQDAVMISNINHPYVEKILLTSSEQISEYLSLNRDSFDIKIHPIGTEFQKQVWNEILKIGYGETLSYRDIARKMNKPNAARAIGTATSKNPLCLVIPCHRVISANKKIGGYSGGKEIKNFLLKMERSQNINPLF